MDGTTLGDTLAMVNVVRSAFGHDQLLDLPDARTGAPADCLYYRALKDVGATSVGGSAIEFASERQARVVAELWGTSRNGKQVAAPKQIKKVISSFDNHELRHYEVDRYDLG